MSKLDELIKNLCPEGVKYFKLGDICEIKTGRGLTKNDCKTDGKYPIISGGVLPLGYYSDFNRNENNVTIARAGNAGFVNFIDIKFWCNDKCFSVIPFKDNLNTKYMYYFLKNIENEIMELKSTGSIPTVNIQKISNVRIAVPSLEVQNEIVHILDNFTELSRELSVKISKELNARKKQYEYYKSMMFETYLSNTVELNTIGEVTKLAGYEFSKYIQYSEKGNIIALRGLNIKAGKLILKDVKYIDNSDFSKLSRSKLYKNDILYTYVGTVGQVGMVDCNDKYYLAPNVARIRIIDKNVLPKFVMYFLQTQEFKVNQLDKLSGESSMKNITMTNIRKFKIPIPTLEKQKRIVNILDKFDKLCNDISEGLPAEIEARQKQYEYYRNKLLSFKDLQIKK